MRKKAMGEIIFLFLLSLVPLWWFRGTQMLLGHDSGFRLIPWDHLKNIFYSWNSYINVGKDWSLYKAFLVTQLPETVLGQPLALVLWFFLIGIGMWLGIYLVFPEKQYRFFRIWSSLFAMYNFYILQGWFIAERAKFSLFAALPIAVALLYRILILNKNIVTHAIAFGLLYFFLNGGGSPPLYGATLVALASAFVWFSIVAVRRSGRIALKRSILIGFGIAGTILILNAYWIIPQLGLYLGTYSQALSDSGGIEGLISWESVISRNAGIVNLLRLQGIPDWYDSLQHPFSKIFLTNPILITASFVPAILSLAGGIILWYQARRGRKERLGFFVFLFMLLAEGLVLAPGSHPPFGFAFVWAMRHVPGFAIFRSSFYKFAPLVWIPIIILSGYALNSFLNRLRNSTTRLLTGILCITGILLYHYPFFTTDIFTFYDRFSTRVTVPDYVRNMGSYVNSTIGSDERLLILPALDSGYYNVLLDTSSWGYFSLDVLARSIINRGIVANDNAASPIIFAIYDAVRSGDRIAFESLTNILGIRYVLWRDDAVYKNAYSDNRSVAAQKKQLTAWRYPLIESAGLWQLYEISSAPVLPRLYVSKQAISVYGDTVNHPSIISHVIQNPKTILVDELADSSETVKNAVNGTIYQARCVYCTAADREKMLHGVTIDDLRFAPESLLYKRMIHTQIAAMRQSTAPASRIDAQIIRADTALSVIKWYLDHGGSKTIPDAVSEYQTLMNDVIRNLDLLSGKEKNDYAIRLFTFLDAQARYVKTIQTDKNQPVLLNALISDYQAQVSKNIWMTEDNLKLKYDVNVGADGDYQFVRIPDVGSVFLDGKPIPGETVPLTRGYHQMLVVQSAAGPVPELYFKKIGESGSGTANVTFQHTDPATYIARVQNDAPFFLVLNEQFDRRWRLKIDGENLPESRHVRADGYANAWYIDSSGSREVVIYYEPYRIFLAAGAISLLGIIGGVTYIVLLKRRNKI